MSTIHCSSEVDACKLRLRVGSATLTIVLSIATSRTLRHRTARIHQRRAWVLAVEVMRPPAAPRPAVEQALEVRQRPGAGDEAPDVRAQHRQLRLARGADVRRDGHGAERPAELLAPVAHRGEPGDGREQQPQRRGRDGHAVAVQRPEALADGGDHRGELRGSSASATLSPPHARMAALSR